MSEEQIKMFDDFKNLDIKSQKTFLKMYKLTYRGDVISKIVLFCMRLCLKISLKFELCKYKTKCRRAKNKIKLNSKGAKNNVKSER